LALPADRRNRTSSDAAVHKAIVIAPQTVYRLRHACIIRCVDKAHPFIRFGGAFSPGDNAFRSAAEN
jgi:hypothetical protein